MLAALQRAYEAKKPIVVTIASPHWAFAKWHLKILKDPKQGMGAPQQIHTIASKKFNSADPKVVAAIKKWSMDAATLAQLEQVVAQEHQNDHDAGAAQWVKDHAGIVSNMIGDVTGSGQTITIGIASGFSEDIAVSYLWKAVLESKGFQVTIQNLDVAPVYIGLSKGQIDLFFDSWLPTSHKTYWDKYAAKVVDVGIWYKEGLLTMTVPAYMNNVNSIADLTKKSVGDSLHWTITGINPSAGITKQALKAMKAYGLN
jgi:ABC-type proline/glycine betaine transport system substrate-binding protein